MAETRLLFFKEIEDSLTSEGIVKSKSKFVESFELFNVKEESREETEFDLILHFEESSSSWLYNFENEITLLFQKAQNEMEENYLRGDLKGFKLYVEKSLKNISGLDQFGITKASINKLIAYFKNKYELDFTSTYYIPKYSLQVKDGIRRSDIEELYNLSIDDYIDYEVVSIDDFYSILAGNTNSKLQFKCGTAEMVEYIKNLLPLLETPSIKNIQEAGIVYSSKGNLISINNYNKYIHNSKANIVSLSPGLREFFYKLKK